LREERANAASRTFEADPFAGHNPESGNIIFVSKFMGINPPKLLDTI
jgi:hypothetical protein